MKILHLINYFNDDLDYQENRLINLQKNNGHKVNLITSDRFFPFKDYDLLYKKTLGNRVVGSKEYLYKGVNIKRKKVFFEIKNHAQCFFFNILDVIKLNPDIIHIHNCGTYTFISTLIYSLLLKKKVFIDCHQDKNNTKNSFLNKIHNYIWKIIYAIFESTIFCFLPINQNSKKFVKDNFGILEKNIIISPLGFDKCNKYDFAYKKKLQFFKYFKNGSEKDLVIINSGKQNHTKKIHKLIEFVKILNKKKINCKLVLIGNSTQQYKIFLKNQITKAHRVIGQNKILQLPFQDKKSLRYFLTLSDVAIWPGIPSITIQESLFFDNILMLPQRSASSHLLTSKFLIFHNDLNKTANNLIKVIKSKKILNSIRIKNKNILEKLSWERINSDLEKIYEK